jgi:hypothetical protein
MLGQGAAGRLVLVYQEKIDSASPKQIGTLAARNAG